MNQIKEAGIAGIISYRTDVGKLDFGRFLVFLLYIYTYYHFTGHIIILIFTNTIRRIYIYRKFRYSTSFFVYVNFSQDFADLQNHFRIGL